MDFLHPLPARPRIAWLILLAGVVFALMTLPRYQDVSEALTLERLAGSQPDPAPVAAAGTAPALSSRLLGRNWNALLNGLETSLPDKVALLELEIDADKGVLDLVAETPESPAMFDYVRRLRDQAGHTGAVLRHHAVDREDPEAPEASAAPIRFAVRIPWRQP